MAYSYFTGSGDDLVPDELARGLWSEHTMHGVAVSGALARALERGIADLGRDDLRPARFILDMFRPAAMLPSRTSACVVREGRRLCLVDATMEQDGEVVARASGLFLKTTEPAPGAVWEPIGSPEPPPLDLAPPTDQPQVPVFASEAVGWDPSFAAHQNDSRKTNWQVIVGVLPDEVPSGFVVAASAADSTSMLTNWGTKGVEYINSDIILSLVRLPVSREIGLSVLDRVSHDGISVGTVTVFDREGRVGTAMTTALANTQRTVDFKKHDFSDDPRSAGA